MYLFLLCLAKPQRLGHRPTDVLLLDRSCLLSGKQRWIFIRSELGFVGSCHACATRKK